MIQPVDLDRIVKVAKQVCKKMDIKWKDSNAADARSRIIAALIIEVEMEKGRLQMSKSGLEVANAVMQLAIVTKQAT